MKTVNELYDELGQLIKEGHGDTRVIANCEFNITKGNGYYNDFPLCYLKDVYYQSGDIELEFSQEEEFTEEKKYKDDDNGWHDLMADPNDLPKNRHNVWITYINAYHQTETTEASFRHKYWVINGHRTECDVIAWCEIPKYKEK